MQWKGKGGGVKIPWPPFIPYSSPANPTGNFLTFPRIFFYQFLKIAVLSTLMYNFSIHICTYIWSICIESPVNADIFIRRIGFTTNDRTVLGHFLKFTIYSFTITPLYSHNNIASVFLCITYDSFGASSVFVLNVYSLYAVIQRTYHHLYLLNALSV